MSAFSNFAVSFTIISILSGCLTLYGFGMNTGGPAVIIWGWLVVGLMTLFVGLAMAEVCSSYPTAGGLYYWAAKLAPPQRRRPGRGSPAGSTSSARSPSPPASTSAPRSSSTPCSTCSSASTPRPATRSCCSALILLLHGLLNTFGVRLVALLNDISVWWHVVGVAVIVGALAIVPDQHQSADFVFTEFVNNTGWGSRVLRRAASAC